MNFSRQNALNLFLLALFPPRFAAVGHRHFLLYELVQSCQRNRFTDNKIPSIVLNIPIGIPDLTSRDKFKNSLRCSGRIHLQTDHPVAVCETSTIVVRNTVARQRNFLLIYSVL